MHVTFDLAEIKELMPQQARKQLEAELAAFAVCIQLFWSVQSSPESRFYRDPRYTFPERCTCEGLGTRL